MRLLDSTLLVLVVVVYSDAAAMTPQQCGQSTTCGSGSCCRDSSGSIISNQPTGGFGGVFLQPSFGRNGTCSPMRAQKGEPCDSNCQCDTGLACYRPVSGVCCPPMLCYDEAYVKQQQAYWANCMKDPHCGLPP